VSEEALAIKLQHHVWNKLPRSRSPLRALQALRDTEE